MMPDEFVTAPVTPPDPGLDDAKLVVLARDMAWCINRPDKLLAALGITQESFDYWIIPNAFYKKAYETFVIEWESASSTNKRLAVKSAVALETNLATLAARMGSAKENLPAVIEAAKLFAKLAGAGEERRDQAVGEKFTININLGNKKLEFTETIGTPAEIQPFSEGAIEVPPLLSLPKGSGS